MGSAQSCDDSEWSSEAQLCVGKTLSMPTDCYACQQAGPDAPFRERFVRHGGWRVAHDFNSSLAGWLVVVPLRHVHALDELTAEEATALGDLAATYLRLAVAPATALIAFAGLTAELQRLAEVDGAALLVPALLVAGGSGLGDPEVAGRADRR